MSIKPWYQSKTVWIAIAQGVIGTIAAVIAADPAIRSVGTLAFLKSLLDILVRSSTSDPIQ